MKFVWMGVFFIFAPGFALFGRLLRTGVCSRFQLMGLALCFIDLCTLFCHAYSLPQRAERG